MRLQPQWQIAGKRSTGKPKLLTDSAHDIWNLWIISHQHDVEKHVWFLEGLLRYHVHCRAVSILPAPWRCPDSPLNLWWQIATLPPFQAFWKQIKMVPDEVMISMRTRDQLTADWRKHFLDYPKQGRWFELCWPTAWGAAGRAGCLRHSVADDRFTLITNLTVSTLAHSIMAAFGLDQKTPGLKCLNCVLLSLIEFRYGCRHEWKALGNQLESHELIRTEQMWGRYLVTSGDNDRPATFPCDLWCVYDKRSG